MTLQFSTTLINTRLDAIETTLGTAAILHIATGSVPANCAAADSGTTLIDMSLPSDYLSAASGGVKSKNGTWSGTATGTGTPGHFRMKDSGAAAVHVQGSAGVGSGDLNLNGNFTSGQTVTISAFAITGAGA